MKIKSKVGAVIGALALASGAAVAAAPIASAQSGDAQGWYQGGQGLYGNIDAKSASGNSFVIPANGTTITWSNRTGGDATRFYSIKAGSGYCVWEQMSVEQAGGGGFAPAGSKTYGKIGNVGQPSQYWETLSSKRVTGPDGPESIVSNFQIYAC